MPPPTVRTYARLYPTPPYVGVEDGTHATAERQNTRSTNRHHCGILHSSFKNTSSFVNQCSLFGVHSATTYRYDRLNRIKQMKAYQGDVSNGVWTADQQALTYSSFYKYDFNGNITELKRYAGEDKIDDLEYFYDHENHANKTGLVSNRLYLVDEQSTHVGGDDLKQGSLVGADFNRNNPATWNYHYDPIGNLIKGVNDSIDLITWTVTGKVSDVIFASSKDDLSFRYDPMGNRIAKIQKPKNWTDEEEWTITWYARDAQGNVLAVYNKARDSVTFRATEFNIYGSSRIGMVTQPEQLNETLHVPERHTQILGLKVYEFSNHLGNVLTTFSDRKIAFESTTHPGYVSYYTAEILSATDYYPFGFQMPGRVYEGEGYRYGFGGHERDDEVKGSGNTYSTQLRLLDVRTGRWFSVDPCDQFFSPYISLGNNPLNGIDPDGGYVFRLIGSTKEQRDAARAFQKEHGGTIVNIHRRSIHVLYTPPIQDDAEPPKLIGLIEINMVDQQYVSVNIMSTHTVLPQEKQHFHKDGSLVSPFGEFRPLRKFDPMTWELWMESPAENKKQKFWKTAAKILYSIPNSVHILVTGKTIGGRTANPNDKVDAFVDVAPSLLTPAMTFSRQVTNVKHVDLVKTNLGGYNKVLKQSGKAFESVAKEGLPSGTKWQTRAGKHYQWNKLNQQALKDFDNALKVLKPVKETKEAVSDN